MCLLEGLKVDWGPVYDQEIIVLYANVNLGEHEKKKCNLCSPKSCLGIRKVIFFIPQFLMEIKYSFGFFIWKVQPGVSEIVLHTKWAWSPQSDWMPFWWIPVQTPTVDPAEFLKELLWSSVCIPLVRTISQSFSVIYRPRTTMAPKRVRFQVSFLLLLLICRLIEENSVRILHILIKISSGISIWSLLKCFIYQKPI